MSIAASGLEVAFSMAANGRTVGVILPSGRDTVDAMRLADRLGMTEAAFRVVRAVGRQRIQLDGGGEVRLLNAGGNLRGLGLHDVVIVGGASEALIQQAHLMIAGCADGRLMLQ